MTRPRIGFLVSGPKGLSLLKGLQTSCEIAFVSSHPVRGLRLDAYAEVREFCRAHGCVFVERDALTASVLQQADAVFVAGWQYLIAHEHERLVVFHDSLLPEVRGFAPTVTALIAGRDRIGVSAFRPVAAFDAGPLYAQAAASVTYPLTIRDAYTKLAACYTEAGQHVLGLMARQSLLASATPQDESRATYSVWRGPDDYLIDWRWSAAKIRRFIDAVGWPYEGARTTYGGDVITVVSAHEIADLQFEERHAGKVWRIEDGCPEIICGHGMLRIDEAVTASGAPVSFTRVRERLGAGIASP